jgi:hypothetical protein
MKTALSLALFCCFTSMELHAQSPKSIEADLLKDFTTIGDWQQKARAEKEYSSLCSANESFASKLKAYTGKIPATISQPFNSLRKKGLEIYDSTDGLFRIYSWDTSLGGTMYQFGNVIQYKIATRTNSNLYWYSAGHDQEYKYFPNYFKLYTFNANGKAYYLAVYRCVYSTKDAGEGIQVFSIEDGKINGDTRLIKTASGFKSKLYYDYDFFSVVDIAFEKRPTITFDDKSQIIRLPLVDLDGKVTVKHINYKFTGKYFERVKS